MIGNMQGISMPDCAFGDHRRFRVIAGRIERCLAYTVPYAAARPRDMSEVAQNPQRMASPAQGSQTEGRHQRA
jgi:hypothetical protein